MSLFARALWLSLACVSAASCGSSDAEPDFEDDPTMPGRTTNPDGVPYPTDHQGGAEHTRSRPGDRIPNFTFRGYVDGDHSKLQTISMADYFDPQQKRHKVLHIQLAATWCAYCSAKLTDTVKVQDELRKEGIVFLEVVLSGAKAQAGPSLGEVDRWVTRHGTSFSTAIDVRARRFAPLGIDGSVMPWDMLVDTRTMEILESSGGSPAVIADYARDGLEFVQKNPPAAY